MGRTIILGQASAPRGDPPAPTASNVAGMTSETASAVRSVRSSDDISCVSPFDRLAPARPGSHRWRRRAERSRRPRRRRPRPSPVVPSAAGSAGPGRSVRSTLLLRCRLASRSRGSRGSRGFAGSRGAPGFPDAPAVPRGSRASRGLGGRCCGYGPRPAERSRRLHRARALRQRAGFLRSRSPLRPRRRRVAAIARGPRVARHRPSCGRRSRPSRPSRAFLAVATATRVAGCAVRGRVSGTGFGLAREPAEDLLQDRGLPAAAARAGARPSAAPA